MSVGQFDVRAFLTALGMWTNTVSQVGEPSGMLSPASGAPRDHGDDADREAETVAPISPSFHAREKLQEERRREYERSQQEYINPLLDNFAAPSSRAHPPPTRSESVLEEAKSSLDRSLSTVDELASLHDLVAASTRAADIDMQRRADPSAEAAERAERERLAALTQDERDRLNLPRTQDLQDQIAALVTEEDVELGSTLAQLTREQQEKEKEKEKKKESSRERPLGVADVSSVKPSAKHELLDRNQEDERDRDRDQRDAKDPSRVASNYSDLELQNMRLKQELGVFDADFFEQLEDLKYKYKELVDVVGEDPLIQQLQARKNSFEDQLGRESTRKDHSIDALPWTRRDPSTIADKASMSASLYRRREGKVLGGSGAGGVGPALPPSGKRLGMNTASLCEQRLMHAIDELPDPLKSVREVCRQIMLVGSESMEMQRQLALDDPLLDGDASYISVPELSTILLQSNLYLGQAEVEMLASGFASNGRGGVSTAELCQTLFQLLYHIIKRREGEQSVAKRRDGEADPDDFLMQEHFRNKRASEQVGALIEELGDDILCYDKLAIFGTQNVLDYNNYNYIVERLLKPFVEIEEDAQRRYGEMVTFKGNSGGAEGDEGQLPVLSFDSFQLAVKEIGGMLSRMDLALCAKYYSVAENLGPRSGGNQDVDAMTVDPSVLGSTTDMINNFRQNQLTGSLRGSSRNQPRYKQWLHTHDIREDRDLDQDQDPDSLGATDPDSIHVLYVPFVVRLAETIRNSLVKYEEEQDGAGDIGTIRRAIFANRTKTGKYKGAQSMALGMHGSKGGDLSAQNKGQATLLWLTSSDVFDIIDNIIMQLERLKCGERRRRLLTLQYCFTQSDKQNSGDVDGFSVLKALLTAKFSLPKMQRTRLLRAVEELGGTLSYVELCQVLMQSCADWTAEERVIISKILKAMGLTVSERRNWLTKLRADLSRGGVAQVGFAANSRNNPKMAKRGAAAPPQVLVGSPTTITPIAFLHCLRNNGIMLDVDEEATLLDCMDAEQMALKLSRTQADKVVAPKNNTEKDILAQFQSFFGEDTMVEDAGGGGSSSMQETASAIMEEEIIGEPLIFYKSFLALCARYVGAWQDAAPDIAEAIRRAVTPKVVDYKTGETEPIAPVINNIQEFSTLCKAFDDSNCGFIGHRAFQIACHRAKLFQTSLDTNQIKTLSDVLSSNAAATGEAPVTAGKDGDGSGAIASKRIKYSAFVVYLRGLVSACSGSSGKSGGEDSMVIGGGGGGVNARTFGVSDSSTTGQLLAHCVDEKTGTVIKLRNWLVKHTDITTCLLTSRDVHAMLREFGVIYRQEHYVEFLHEVGQGIPLPKAAPQTQGQGLGSGLGDEEVYPIVMDSRLLLLHVLEKRGSWTQIYTSLTEKIYRMLQVAESSHRSSIDASAGMSLMGSKAHTSGSANSGLNAQSTGLSAYARKIYKRLRVLSDVNAMQSPTPPAVLTAKASLAMEEDDDDQYGRDGLRYEANIGGYSSNQLSAKRNLLLNKQAAEREIAARHYDAMTALNNSLVVDSLGVCINKNMFRNILVSMGVSLSAKDCEILSDTTDWHPSGQRIRCNVVLEALRYCSLTQSSGSNTGKSKDGKSPRTKAPVSPRFVEPNPEALSGSGSDQHQFSESETYVINHIKLLLWRTAEVARRTPAQWRADVYSLFRGFDVNKGNPVLANAANRHSVKTKQVGEANTSLTESIEQKLSGFVTLQDFSIALGLLNCSVSGPLLFDLPYLGGDGTKSGGHDNDYNVGAGPQVLVPYMDILALLLVAPIEEMQAEADAKRRDMTALQIASKQKTFAPSAADMRVKGAPLHGHGHDAATREKENAEAVRSTASASSQDVKAALKPFDPTVGALLYVVRKAPEFVELIQQQKHQGSHAGHAMPADKKHGHGKTAAAAAAAATTPLTLAQEQAWMTLLKIFQKFDADEAGTVTPRQFCMAVSVLLSDDDVIFTKEDWFHVINFYTLAVNPKKARMLGRLHERGTAVSEAPGTSGIQAVDYMTFCEMVVSPNPVYMKEFLKVEHNAHDNMIRQRKIEAAAEHDDDIVYNHHDQAASHSNRDRDIDRDGHRHINEEDELYSRARNRSAAGCGSSNGRTGSSSGRRGPLAADVGVRGTATGSVRSTSSNRVGTASGRRLN